MITFNDCRISDEKDKLIIDCIVDTEYLLQDVWISTIQLVYYNNILSDGSIKDESKVVTVYDDSEGIEQMNNFSGYVALADLEPMSGTGEERVVFDKGLFYVIVTCDGSDAPANYQDFVVIPDWQFIYSVGMTSVSYISSIDFNGCNFPPQFEEFAIIWYAMQLAFATCEFTQIEYLWNKFLRFAGAGSKIATVCPCNR